ncbi:MAG TPA: NAD(P)-binding domain-containing protein [Terriglobales bacterium]|nr:NAD(P)-binding domain-containing protein [Terriglobales bacterium]
MKIGVLGSGVVGQTLAAGFLKHGHQVMLGTRDPQKQDVQAWLKKTPGAQAGTFEQTAKFAELAVLATLGRVAEDVLQLAGSDDLAGKTIIDTTNPLADTPPVNGVLAFTTGPNESLAERLQAKVPRSHVVKAFNSVGSTQMVDPHYEQGTPTMFLCGNDPGAKGQASEIIRQLGWEPFDCGGITAARAIEPLCMLWCIPGFLRNQWNHAFKVLTG